MYPSSLPAGNNSAAPKQRPGWNLQWRTAPSIVADQAREVSDAAFVADQVASSTPDKTSRMDVQANHNTGNVTSSHGHDSIRNQLRDPAGSDVQRVAWLTQQTETDGGGGFTLPGNAFRDGSATAPEAAEIIQPGPAFQMPEPEVTGELPPPKPTPSQVPQSVPGSEAAGLEQLFGDRPSTPAPSSTPPASTPPTGAPPAGPDSSIRDMLQDAPERPEPLQEVDPQEMSDDLQDSPSDRESFEPNPFGNRDTDQERDREPKDRENEDASARDQRDRDRLKSGDAPSISKDDEEGPTNSATGLSCNDFRERIRGATIDQVSLDPSPPFRPDVIDNDEFEKLKNRFSEKQASRTWRSIDGRPLGTGRLDDLAYEKAIITTEFGSREELPLNRLSEADLAYISSNWGLPTECLIEQVAYTPRTWTPTTMTYMASNLCHKPLYFEEVNLERYGHTAGPLCQPIVSSAHFFLNIAVLPYKMGVHSPHECQYALGYYRPGNCAPWIIPPVPLSVRGAWYQAAAVTGTALLIP